MIVAIGDGREAAFLCTAGVVGVGSGGDTVEVAPGIEGVGFAPAVRRAGGMCGGGERPGDAVQRVVSEGLRAGGVEIVGDAVDVAGVVASDGVDEAVGDVDRVATAGGSLELAGLQAVVEGMCKVEAGEAAGNLSDRERIEGALRRIGGWGRESFCSLGERTGLAYHFRTSSRLTRGCRTLRV